MIDIDGIKRNVDLLSLVGIPLRKVGNTAGGEFAGPCPFCGIGQDRFHVQPYHRDGGRWTNHGGGEARPACICGTADKQWHSNIDFIMFRDGVPFEKACEILSGDNLRSAVIRPVPIKAGPKPLSQAPGPDWQAAAIQAVAETQHYLLRSGEPDAVETLNYLQKHRGLSVETIENFGIGYNWRGRRIGGDYWLAQGITIPGLIGKDFWCINVRTPKAAQKRGRPKYQAMSGSVKSLHGADALAEARIAVVVEGEFDALLAGQYAPAGVAVVASGGASVPAERWSLLFARCRRVWLAFDNDQAGRQAVDAWSAAVPRSAALAVPGGHNDVTDFWRAEEKSGRSGVDALVAWLQGAADYNLQDLQRAVAQ